MRAFVLGAKQRVDRVASCVVAAAFALSACFSDSTAPTPESDGEQLLAGLYDGPLVVRDQDETYLVAARRGSVGAEPRIDVFPISEPDRRCSVVGEHSGWGTLGGNGRPVIKLLRPTGSPNDADLELYNGGCKVIAEVAGVLPESMQRVVVDDLPVGLVAEARTREIVFVDVVTREVTTLSTGLGTGLPRSFEMFGKGDSRVWVVEPSQLSIVDTLGGQEARIDATVSELATTADHAVFVDSGNLYSITAEQLSPELVADDVCRPQLDAFERSGELVYRTTFLSPCSQRRLVTSDLTDLASQPLANDVESWWTFGEWIFYRTLTGQLFVVPPTGATVRVAEDATPMAAVSPDSFLITLGDPDSSTAALFRNGEIELLASELSDFVVGHERVALVSDRDSPFGGTLTVFDADRVLVHSVAEGIDPTGIAFAAQTPELRYQVNDDGSSRLDVWDADSGEVKTIDTGVSGFVREVRAPEPGLVYSVTDPARAGLWFAPLDP